MMSHSNEEIHTLCDSEMIMDDEFGDEPNEPNHPKDPNDPNDPNRVQTKDQTMDTIVIIENTEQSLQNVSKVITDDELYHLYQTFDINFDEIHRKYSVYRFNVIHIRGVQEMSSEDVLHYFMPFDPASIEWVNDLSCNVLFDDNKSAGIAMKELTTALVTKVSTDVIDIDLGIDIIDADTLDVPIPPGRWRLGKGHDKSKALLLRFANTSDRKIKGARKLSDYYAKYGLPLTRDFTTDDGGGNGSSNEQKGLKRSLSNDNDSGDEIMIKDGVKKLRMRMRADDEEEQMESRKRITNDRLGIIHEEEEYDADVRKSIWERLDNDEFGNYCSIDANLLQIAIINDQKEGKSNVWQKLDYDKTPIIKSQISKPFNKSRVDLNVKKTVKNFADLRNRIGKRK